MEWIDICKGGEDNLIASRAPEHMRHSIRSITLLEILYFFLPTLS